MGGRPRGVNAFRAYNGGMAAAAVAGRRAAVSRTSTGSCAGIADRRAGGRGNRPSRSASGPSSCRTPPGRTSRRRSARCARRAGCPTRGWPRCGRGELAALIRPAGCHTVKARRLAAFLDWLGRECGAASRRCRRDPPPSAPQLLAVHGIGRETADSIALYAAGLPLFVIDAYTRRVFARLGLVGAASPTTRCSGASWTRCPATRRSSTTTTRRSSIHAKDVCRIRPLCARCPARPFCPEGGSDP